MERRIPRKSKIFDRIKNIKIFSNVLDVCRLPTLDGSWLGVKIFNISY